MTFNSKEEVREAFTSLKEEEKEYLYKAYEKAKELPLSKILRIL